VNLKDLNKYRDADESGCEEVPVLNNGSPVSTPSPPWQRKYHEVPCPNFNNNDISMEYKGRLPKKGSFFSMSRDSGVNCVGLAEATKCVQGQRQSLNNKIPAGTVLNNQTAQSKLNIPASREGSLDPNVVVHHAQVHLCPDNQMDSGFSSPRTDTTQYSGKNINIRQTFPKTSTPTNHNQASRLHPVETTKNNGMAAAAAAGRGKMTSASMESMPITSSDRYPSYGQYLETNLDSAGSSKSELSTVVEQNGKVIGRTSNMQRSAAQRKTKPEPTYMEIEPIGENSHGYIARDKSPRRHSRQDIGYETKCAVHGERSAKRPVDYNGHVNGLSRGAYNEQRQRRKALPMHGDPHYHHQQGNRDPRVAALGDVQLVGIL